MNVSERFLTLVKRVSTDIDVEKIRADVEVFSLAHPELTTRAKARRMINLTARKAALVGAVASLPPGWASGLAIGPELTALLVLQSRLIVGLHLLYGGPMEPKERALEVLAGLAAGAGLHVGRRLTTRFAEELAGRLVLRIAGREATRFVPVLGAAACAALNFAAVRGIGRGVLRRVEALYGPPEVEGLGPVVEVEGRLS